MNEYIQDDSGQWWAHVHRKDGTFVQRSRAYHRTCAECGAEFLRRGKQTYCSLSCRTVAAAGRRRESRELGSPLPTDEYWQDEDGQWYCKQQRAKLRRDGQPIIVRLKVYPRTCEQCGQEFVKRHKQRCCSNACRSKFETGKCKKKEPPRACPICANEFHRKVRRPWRQTCSTKCAHALARQNPNYLPRMPGELHPNWKGGKRHVCKTGYVMVYAGPGQESRLEHRIVMEEVLGRPLGRFEEVHHKNAIRGDNRPENLELWVKRQPAGARAKDLIEYAHWILDTYGPVEDKIA